MKRFVKSVFEIKFKYFLLIIIVSTVLCVILTQFIFKREYLPVLIWWTPLLPERKVINCLDKFRCLVTKQNHNYNEHLNADAYLFYGSHLQHYDVPVPRNNSIWAIFHEESPKNLASFLYSETQELFNVTSTFSRDSNFPLTLQYLRNVNDITDLTYFVSLAEKNILLKDLSPVLYIQSDCDTPLQRDAYVEELMNHINVDSYGLCLKNRELPAGISELDPLDYYNEKIIHFTAKYKFTLAMENSVCYDYITEKLWRPLIAGSIPIYLGSPIVEDWLPNNNSAILIKNYKSIEELAEYIKQVNENDHLYEKFMEHKTSQKINNNLLKETVIKDFHASEWNSEGYTIPAFECYVCKSIHEKKPLSKNHNRSVFNCPEPATQYGENSWLLHWRLGKCQSKAFRALVDQKRKYTDKEFEKAWLLLYEKNNC